MADRFALCLDEVLRHEGGFSDHPADPGGATNMGITRKTLASWRQVSPWTALPKAEVQRLTRTEAGKIYRAHYWNKCHADLLPFGVDMAVFDYAVNSGPGRAIRTLQQALGVAVDGVVGPVTIAAAGKVDGTTLVDQMCDRRLAFLKTLATFPTFGRGWTSRVASVRRVAHTAAAITNPRGDKWMTVFSGYKTYIVAVFMLLAGLAQVLGIDLPSLDGGAAGSLILEAMAIIFLRQGLKGDVGKA